jgi:hypothetical protein
MTPSLPESVPKGHSLFFEVKRHYYEFRNTAKTHFVVYLKLAFGFQSEYKCRRKSIQQSIFRKSERFLSILHPTVMPDNVRVPRVGPLPPASFRLYLAVSTLSVNGWLLQTPIVDLHHQVIYHARRTKKIRLANLFGHPVTYFVATIPSFPRPYQGV